MEGLHDVFDFGIRDFEELLGCRGAGFVVGLLRGGLGEFRDWDEVRLLDAGGLLESDFTLFFGGAEEEVSFMGGVEAQVEERLVPGLEDGGGLESGFFGFKVLAVESETLFLVKELLDTPDADREGVGGGGVWVLLIGCLGFVFLMVFWLLGLGRWRGQSQLISLQVLLLLLR